jgi:hypothetical protein
MKLCDSNPKHRPLPVPYIVLAGFAALLRPSGIADAATVRNEPLVLSRPAGEPVMAVVSLRDQQVSINDDKGLIMRAPVSVSYKQLTLPTKLEV